MRRIGIISIALVLGIWGCSSKEDVVSSAALEEETVSVSVSEETSISDEVKRGEKVLIRTTKGNMTVLLYDDTPLHQQNFLKLVNEGFYDSLLFHRVIKQFMVQGGDPNSRGASSSTRLGSGGPGYTIPAEFNPKFIHKKGALAAARTGGPGNPEKKSSGSQYYIVQGKTLTDAELDNMERRVQGVSPGFKYTPEQREIYKILGGTPFLDMDYTVYGEVIEGLNVIDSIAAVKTVPGDRPVEDIVMFMQVIN